MDPTNETDIVLLEDFRDGNLSAEQLEAVEKRMQTDQNFKQLHDNLEQTIFLLKEYYIHENESDKTEIRRHFNELEKSLSIAGEEDAYPEHAIPLKRIHSLFRSRYFMLAAAVTVLLIVMGVFLKYNADNRSDQIFQEYFSPYDNIIMPQKMGNEVEDNELHQAYKVYESKSYKEACILFENILKKNQDAMVLFFAGNAYLATHYDKKAVEKFLLLENNYADFSFIEHVQWYLALSYLHQGKIAEAKKEFSKLETSDYYKERIAIILPQLTK